MGLYGPFTGVAGTIQKCELDQNIEAVYIRNTSRFDLAVAFQSQQPGQATVFGGPPWYATIPAGDRAGLRIPAVYGGPGFPGWIWVLPVDNSGSLALSGTTSANNNFYIETYADADFLPPDYASPQFVNAASQQRVINVPVIPHTIIIGQSIAAVLPIDRTSFSDNSGEIYTFPSILAAPQIVTIYLYSFSFVGVGFRISSLQLIAEPITTGGALVGTAFSFYTGVLIPGITEKMAYPYPLAAQITCPATAKYVTMRYIIGALFSSPGTGTIYYNTFWDVDPSGQTPTPAIGNGGATPKGVVY